MFPSILKTREIRFFIMVMVCSGCLSLKISSVNMCQCCGFLTEAQIDLLGYFLYIGSFSLHCKQMKDFSSQMAGPEVETS